MGTDQSTRSFLQQSEMLPNPGLGESHLILSELQEDPLHRKPPIRPIHICVSMPFPWGSGNSSRLRMGASGTTTALHKASEGPCSRGVEVDPLPHGNNRLLFEDSPTIAQGPSKQLMGSAAQCPVSL